MSSSYLLLKNESALNQTQQSVEENASGSTLLAAQTQPWGISEILILTLILFCANVLFKMIEKALDYVMKRAKEHSPLEEENAHDKKFSSKSQ